MRFKSFCTKQGYSEALDDPEEATAEMQVELYTSLALALQRMILLTLRRPMLKILSVAPKILNFNNPSHVHGAVAASSCRA